MVDGRGHRLRLGPGGHGRPRPQRGTARAGRAEVGAARARGVGEEDLRLLLGRRGGGTGRGHRRARRHLHPALRGASIRPAWCGGWPTRSNAAGVACTSRPRSGPSTRATVAHHARHRAGRHGGPGHRGIHAGSLAGEAAHPGAGVLADDRDRAAVPTPSGPRSGLAARETFSDHRHTDHLRAADRGRAAGVRRPGRALPLRFGHPAGVRPRRRRARALHRTLVELFPTLAGCRDHPPVGRPAGHRPGLVPLGGHRPGHRHRLGRAATSATASRPPTWPAGR